MDPQDIDLILVFAAGARGCVGPLVGRKDARAREFVRRESGYRLLYVRLLSRATPNASWCSA